MKRTGFAKTTWMATIFCVATAVASHAQTFTTLASFDYSDGSNPTSLVQGPDGNFYGTAYYGGTATSCDNLKAGYGCGTVFKVTPTGEITTLHIFCSKANCADGGQPVGKLVLGPNGSFYGVTEYGGNNSATACIGCGTVFEITLGGKFTTLYSFCAQTNCTDGRAPYGGLALGANGNFYGTTAFGGAYGDGSVFEITSAGKFTTLYSFCAKTNCPDGSLPAAALVQATNGDLYGSTDFGGAYDEGVIFAITTAGDFTALSSLRGNRPDPNPMIQAADGNLYGTTYAGGGYGGGSFFTMTLTGNLTYLYYFCPPVDCGFKPTIGVIQATDGNFYGTTSGGGTDSEAGTLYRMTPTGGLAVLYNFCYGTGCTGGWDPVGLIQATDGNFYGVTAAGGDISNCLGGACGTVFRLSTGLSPFVEATPNFGKAGSVAYILGNNLTGTTSVTFNGAPATFSVVSSTYIKATVPSGATTGTIEVTTPSGTLSSNVAFQVSP
jgi:uncharacterized repeat protein (TIGR03803 family)